MQLERQKSAEAIVLREVGEGQNGKQSKLLKRLKSYEEAENRKLLPYNRQEGNLDGYKESRVIFWCK